MRPREKCPRGHDNTQPGQRYTCGTCVECKKAQAARHYAANTDRRKAQMAAWYRRNHSEQRAEQRRYKWSLRGYISELRTRIKQRTSSL